MSQVEKEIKQVFKERAAFIHKLMFLFDALVLTVIFLFSLILRGIFTVFIILIFFPSPMLSRISLFHKIATLRLC